jgi:nucleoside-diphosphate-sugar epimerase
VRTPTRLFVFGLGYSGSRLALRMTPGADWAGGTVRAIDDALALADRGVRALVFDGEQPGIGVAEAARQATHLVVTIPPGRGDPVLAVHRASILAAQHLTWIAYLSTIGVYGDHGGEWVDEETPALPASARSRARLEAEHAWQALADERGMPLATLRLAGIYGPGRNALVNLADGTAHRIVKAGQVFNRIHVDDVVAVLAAALERRASGVFNLADDEPAPPQDVVTYAADAMDAVPPPLVPFANADLSPMARSFYEENKRARNGKIKSALGVSLAYPTYRDGLAALWRDGTWRGTVGGS